MLTFIIMAISLKGVYCRRTRKLIFCGRMEVNMAFYKRKEISGGIGYTTIIDKKFKTNKVEIRFITELDPETAAENAMAVGIIGSSSSRYKNISELTAKLNSLYGANINISISKRADNQILSIGTSAINNKYAFDGEDINGEVLDILLDCIFSPNAVNEEFAQEPFQFRRKDLLDTIDAEINNKRGYAVMQAQKSIYKGESSANSSYGTKEEAEAATPASAYSAYKRLLKEAQIEIYYVGQYEDIAAEEKIIKAVSVIERDPVICRFKNISPLKAEVCRCGERLDVNQCKMVMAFKSDFEDAYALKLVSTLFGETPISKLFANVREKLSLCYYCASGYNEFKGTMIVDCGIEEANIEKTENEIMNQLKAMQEGDFTDEELENGLLSLENALRGVGDTTNSLVNWYFSHFIKNDIVDPQTEIKRYRSVTRQQIAEAAKSFELDTVYVMRGEEQ